MLSLLTLPIAELVYAFNNNFSFDESRIIFYVFYVFISAIFTLIALLSLGFFRKKAAGPKVHFSFYDRELVFIATIGLILLFYFIKDSVSDFNVINIAIFSEKYRNGIYKGSGIYTFMLFHLLPLMVSTNMAFSKRFSNISFLCLLIVVFASVISGLRVFLIPIVLAFLFRVSDSKVGISKLLLFSFLGLVVLSSFKIYLDLDNLDDKSLVSYLLNPFLRMNFNAIVFYNFLHGLSDMQCILPFSGLLDACDSESFKYNFFSVNPYIYEGFKNLSKYSGVALPLPVYFYNMFGYLAIVFTVLTLISVNFTYKYLKSNNPNVWLNILAFTILVHLSSALFEDLLMIRYLDIKVVLILSLYFSRLFFSKIRRVKFI